MGPEGLYPNAMLTLSLGPCNTLCPQMGIGWQRYPETAVVLFSVLLGSPSFHDKTWNGKRGGDSAPTLRGPGEGVVEGRVSRGWGKDASSLGT